MYITCFSVQCTYLWERFVSKGCYDHYFWQLSPIFGQQLAHFLKNNFVIRFLAERQIETELKNLPFSVISFVLEAE
jgi:hypothetical protein